MSFVGDIIDTAVEVSTLGMVDPNIGGSMRGSSIQDAATGAANISAEAQKEALDYLKQREAVPQQFREEALKGLGGIYGLEGGVGTQQDLIDRAISSPLYQGIMSGRDAGEEAILRNAAATGGLRSGNVQSALYDYNTQLENKALLESYNQQLQGLAGLANLPSNANQIANTISGIGQTKAQGEIAASQIKQDSQQQWVDTGLQGLQMMMFSDRRLKKNITKVGMVNGWNWYTWDWNIVAQKMGMKGSCQGVMADEVFKKNPAAVLVKDLFMMVNYSRIGILKPCEVN